MNDRDIEYLLQKYETKQPGEQWDKETEKKYLQEYLLKQKYMLLSTIINERITNSHGKFRFSKVQSERARLLIQELEFHGKVPMEHYIVMIIVYVKLETNPHNRVQHFYNMFYDYGIELTTFIQFLINLNKHHIQKIPLPLTYE